MFKRITILAILAAVIAGGSVAYGSQQSDASGPDARVIAFDCGWLETSRGAYLDLQGVALNISNEDYFDVRTEFELYGKDGATLLTLRGPLTGAWLGKGSSLNSLSFRHHVDIERSLALSVYDCGVFFKVDGQRLDTVTRGTSMWGDHPDY